MSSSGDVWTSGPIRSTVGARKRIDHASPLHPMSRLVCIVCGLSNRESSKRCSRCLSPLGLRLCYRCESINTLSATQCSQCGASLSSALDEVPTYPAASTEASQRAENAFATVGSVPAALAERLEGAASDRSASAHGLPAPVDGPPPFEAGHPLADPASVASVSTVEPTDYVDEPPSPATAFTGEPSAVDESASPAAVFTGEPASRVDEPLSPAATLTGEPAAYVDEPGSPAAVFTGEPKRAVDDPPSPAAALPGEPAARGEKGPSSRFGGDGPIYSERSRNRASGFLLAALLVAAVGAIYWVTEGARRPPAADTASRGGSTTAPQRASSAPANPQPSTNPSGTQQVPDAAPRAVSSDSSASPPTTVESTSSSAETSPPATVQTPEGAAAQASTATGTTESVDGGAAKTTNAPATGDTRRRTVAPQRTKEQAERDAIATQRLIERELGDSSRAGSASNPPPGP